MAIDATVGGADANSYVTLVEAQAYFDTRFGSAVWDAADPADQEKALLQAARHLSRFRFKGTRNSPSGALPFPRSWPLSKDPESFSSAVSIPTAIKQAQMEEALSILTAVSSGVDTSRAALQVAGVKSYAIGSLQETFADGVVFTDGRTLCREARSLLVGWIDLSGRIKTGRDCRATGTQIANGVWPEDLD